MKITIQSLGIDIMLLTGLKPPDHSSSEGVFVEDSIKIMETAGIIPRRVVREHKAAEIIFIHKATAGGI